MNFQNSTAVLYILAAFAARHSYLDTLYRGESGETLVGLSYGHLYCLYTFLLGRNSAGPAGNADI